MSRPDRKSNHIALKQVTESLLAKQAEGAEAGEFLQRLHSVEFPLPSQSMMTLGNMAPHTAVVGSTGAGKTNILKLMMSYVFPCQNKYGGLRFRGVVYDPKRELYPYLCEIGIPESQIIVTHPFDARSSAWDLAADFSEPAQIEELAEMIVPEQESSNGTANQFFENSARIIVQDVIEGLIANRGKNWDLRDVVQSLSNIEYLKALLHETDNGRDSWDMFLAPADDGRDSRTALNILATIRSFIRPFHSLAALWYRAETKFSIKRWANGAGLLLLGADPERERTVQRVNQLLVRRASQVLLARSDENPVDWTWWFVDELREAARLNGLRQMLNEGRSKGVRVVLGFQDIEGLYALYDKHEAEEMIGLCANRVFLHLDNPGTREWASDFLGESEEEIPEVSKTVGRDSSETTAYKVDMRKNALPIEFHSLPLASPRDGIRGWYAYPGHRNKFWIDPNDIAPILFPNTLSVKPPTFIARDADSQRLPKWNDSDLFGLDLESAPEKDDGDETGRTKKPKGKLKVPPHFRSKTDIVDDFE